jgi:Mg2+ and Co2+ transporter CorA
MIKWTTDLQGNTYCDIQTHVGKFRVLCNKCTLQGKEDWFTMKVYNQLTKYAPYMESLDKIIYDSVDEYKNLEDAKTAGLKKVYELFKESMGQVELVWKENK